MSADTKPAADGFLTRWSRRKVQARESPAAEVEAVCAPGSTIEDVPPELPPVDELTLDSDFRGFLHPKVGEDVRRAALRKLFSDPHFNVMDGLDVYIDDYSKTEPIPPAMLAGLRQAQRILTWAEGKDEAEEEGEENAGPVPENAAQPALLAEKVPASEGTPSEPADLFFERRDPTADAGNDHA